MRLILAAFLILAGLFSTLPSAPDAVRAHPTPLGAPIDPGVAQRAEHRVLAEVTGADPVSGANVGAPSPSAALRYPVEPAGRPGSVQPTNASANVSVTGILSGTASWYRATRGYGDRAYVALPGAHYIPVGQPVPWVTVTIVLSGRVVSGRFPVVDCLCGGIPGRVVDLSLGAVRELGLDPARGLWPVVVEGLSW